MNEDSRPSSFFRAEKQFLMPPDDKPGPDCIRQRKQEICQRMEEILSDYADTFCGEITVNMDFAVLILATTRLAEEIEIYARYLDLLDDHVQTYGI